jgi:hypothetical protein
MELQIQVVVVVQVEHYQALDTVMVVMAVLA